MKIYVGNLSYDVTDEEVRQEFAAFGEVASASVVTDRYTGRPRGFAFVEMTSRSEGEAAIAGLNGKTLRERTLVVSEARPPSEGRRSGSYGGSGGSRGYGGGRSGGSRGRGGRRRY